jgi:hypothetical protein
MRNIIEIINSADKNSPRTELKNKYRHISNGSLCHVNGGKNNLKNGMTVQNPDYITAELPNPADGIELNNVNGIKKILIGIQQISEHSVFVRISPVSWRQTGVQKKSTKTMSVITCNEENYKTSDSDDMIVIWNRYSAKPARLLSIY